MKKTVESRELRVESPGMGSDFKKSLLFQCCLPIRGKELMVHYNKAYFFILATETFSLIPPLRGAQTNTDGKAWSGEL